MTLRVRFALSFFWMLVVCLLATTFLAYYELVHEPLDQAAEREEQEESLAWRLGEVILRGGVPVLLLGLGTWYLARRMLQPIEQLTDAADRISRGQMDQLGQTLPLTGRNDELDELTVSFNRMSERVAQSFSQIREFTLHASHELKTPLTVLRASLEHELTKLEDTDPRHEMLLTRLDEISRLTKIVDGLSLLTKADAEMLAAPTDHVALHSLVRDMIDDLGALAEGQELNVEVLQCDEVNLTGDRHGLRQLLLILADNAVKYNQPKGWVQLSLQKLPDHVEFTIRNSGEGLPKEQATHVFERFYRGDRAGSRSTEGCGLGLSIAKSIVENHGGKISFASTPEHSVVTVALPFVAKPLDRTSPN